MQSTNFVALAGHLSDYPLPDLIETLRRQRKSGRLLIEYAIGPCSLYFRDGDLVDAQLDSLSGLQAVTVALAQPNASFNFNPIIQPPAHSINESSQKIISELLGLHDEKTIDIEAATATRQPFTFVASPDSIHAETEQGRLPHAKEVLALPPSPLDGAARRRNRRVLIASAIISLVVSFVTVAALARWLIRRDISAALSEMTKNDQLSGSRSEKPGANVQTVKVVVEVDKGRVMQAFVQESNPNMQNYEALALKIARGRRYAANATGRDTVLVAINAPK